MDIEEEEKPHGGKRRHQKIKTKKVMRKSRKKHFLSRKTKVKRRRFSLKRK